MLWHVARPMRAVVIVLSIMAMAGDRAMSATFGAESSVRVPIEIVEVVSGGSWVSGTQSGFWRTVTVMVSRPNDSSEVYLQWVGSRSPTAPLEIIASAPLREFNDLHLPSSSVALDSDMDGEARIVVTGETEGRQPTAMTFIARLPGQLEFVPGEPIAPGTAPQDRN
jgi:hypothetical protein